MKWLVYLVVISLLAHFELVAWAAPPTLQEVKQRVEEMDGKLADVKSSIVKLKERGAELKESVGAKTKDLKTLSENTATFSEELKRRAKLFESQEETKQLEALKDIDKLDSRDETVLALGLVSKGSIHEVVRQKALSLAAALGETGYPVMALAFESLSQKDRGYLAKAMNKQKSDDKLVLFALMAKEADDDLLKTLLALELEPDKKLPFMGLVAEARQNDDILAIILEQGEKTPGDAGLLMLYAIAKGGSGKQISSAVQAAVKRKDAAFPVLAAAFKKEDSESRAAVVKAAKQLGGEVGEFIVKTALAEANNELRAVAEAAAK